MIYVVKNLTDPVSTYLKDDPVRPHIPHETRFGPNKAVLALMDGDEVKAIVCAKFTNTIPESETDLIDVDAEQANTAVFYTIWSYKPGAGQKLIRQALKYVRENLPNVEKFVTLSPQTEMAKRFHLNNGAVVFRINVDSVNYEYI